MRLRQALKMARRRQRYSTGQMDLAWLRIRRLPLAQFVRRLAN